MIFVKTINFSCISSLFTKLTNTNNLVENCMDTNLYSFPIQLFV